MTFSDQLLPPHKSHIVIWVVFMLFMFKCVKSIFLFFIEHLPNNESLKDGFMEILYHAFTWRSIINSLLIILFTSYAVITLSWRNQIFTDGLNHLAPWTILLSWISLFFKVCWIFIILYNVRLIITIHKFSRLQCNRSTLHGNEKLHQYIFII